MDDDVRLKNIPSCDETGWTHKKILNLINYPDDVAAKMEEYSVHIYDPRWPIDNTWIPPPEPDTWTFLKDIGRAADEPEEDVKLRGGSPPRTGSSRGSTTRKRLTRSSEAKLARAIDIRGRSCRGRWTSERRTRTTTTD